MKLTVNISDRVVQDYLDHYGEVVGRVIKLGDLPKEQVEGIMSSLSDEMRCELEMRCDDHSGFETENYFYGVFKD